MCTGKRFHLKSEILCIEETECGRVAVTIPAGEVLMVLNGPRPDDRRMVEIEWGERKLVTFVDDLRRRGEEVRFRRPTAV